MPTASVLKWIKRMTDTEKPVAVNITENSFELILRILGNEFIAIRIGSTNFSGKLIAGSILLLFFTFMLLEVFGLSRIQSAPSHGCGGGARGAWATLECAPAFTLRSFLFGMWGIHLLQGLQQVLANGRTDGRVQDQETSKVYETF